MNEQTDPAIAAPMLNGPGAGMLKPLLLVLLLAAAPLPVSAAQLSFGIVPQQSATKLATLWTPIMQYIKRTTGLDIAFATAPNIPEFERRLAAGQYDLAYMNPYHFVVFNQTPGYTAIAHATGKRIKGIMVVRKDSDITTLKQLDGRSLAFPSPAAFAASILTRAELTAQSIDFEPVYVSSHDSVYRSVAKGLFSAGGGIIRTFNNLEADIRSQLRVLWTSEGFTPHAIAAHPDLDPDKARRVGAALVSMGSDPLGRELLQAINLRGFQSATDEAWDDVRTLNLNLLK